MPSRARAFTDGPRKDLPGRQAYAPLREGLPGCQENTQLQELDSAI